jgi:hypothetical protein
MLTSYIRVLEAHGWERVPVDSHIRFYAHPSHPRDRVQVFDDYWSIHHFNGMSWLTTAPAHGTDAASLDAYLSEHFSAQFPSGGK